VRLLSGSRFSRCRPYEGQAFLSTVFGFVTLNSASACQMPIGPDRAVALQSNKIPAEPSQETNAPNHLLVRVPEMPTFMEMAETKSGKSESALMRGANRSVMSPDEYERHLRLELCWLCHGQTHRSHAQQRQCPICRRKWSYVRRRLEWALLQAFCLMDTPYRAAKDLGAAYRTAWSHYMEFERVIRQDGDLRAGLFQVYLPKRELPPERVRQGAAALLYWRRIAPRLARFTSRRPEIRHDSTGRRDGT
jgi:hypothetical protein